MIPSPTSPASSATATSSATGSTAWPRPAAGRGTRLAAGALHGQPGQPGLAAAADGHLPAHRLRGHRRLQVHPDRDGQDPAGRRSPTRSIDPMVEMKVLGGQNPDGSQKDGFFSTRRGGPPRSTTSTRGSTCRSIRRAGPARRTRARPAPRAVHARGRRSSAHPTEGGGARGPLRRARRADAASARELAGRYSRRSREIGRKLVADGVAAADGRQRRADQRVLPPLRPDQRLLQVSGGDDDESPSQAGLPGLRRLHRCHSAPAARSSTRRSPGPASSTTSPRPGQAVVAQVPDPTVVDEG